jgi:hypothetical protein
MGTECTQDIKILKFYCYVIQGLSMTEYGNVGRIPQGDETFLKYFSRETRNTDHFIDTVTEKEY